MISKIRVYKSKNKSPYINLALEEFLTFHVEKSECILYLWQNENTVVIGKNQNCWKECNLDSIKSGHGKLARRMSGGGAVFHDLGNMNFTFCMRSEDYDIDKQLQVVVEAVRSFGIYAVKNGRNDITIDEKKFSGNAFFKSGEFCYHHGTILLDIDKNTMGKYLNVSKEKLISKGVSSVKSRVTNLKEMCPDITVDLFKERLSEAFSKVYQLELDDFDYSEIIPEEVKILEEKYKSWDWIYGRKLLFSHELGKRFTWGDIQIQLQVNGGIIKDIICYSDSLEPDFISQLESTMRDTLYSKEDMKVAVENAARNVSLKDGTMVDDICALIDEQI